MKFEFRHVLFDGGGQCGTHTEDTLPSWLNSKDFQWFRDGHVLTLRVGDSVSTDFHKITRVE